MNSTEDILMWYLSFFNPDIQFQADAFERAVIVILWKQGETHSVMYCKSPRSLAWGLYSLDFILKDEWKGNLRISVFELPCCYFLFFVSHQKLMTVFSWIQSFFSLDIYIFILLFIFTFPRFLLNVAQQVSSLSGWNQFFLFYRR